MNILDLVVGKPIRTSDERAEQIGPARGIPIFGLDALSSAAYGPEAALSLLIPLGLLGVRYIIPISAAIITLPSGSKVKQNHLQLKSHFREIKRDHFAEGRGWSARANGLTRIVENGACACTGFA